jgi:hypothetical protein
MHIPLISLSLFFSSAHTLSFCCGNDITLRYREGDAPVISVRCSESLPEFREIGEWKIPPSARLSFLEFHFPLPTPCRVLSLDVRLPPRATEKEVLLHLLLLASSYLKLLSARVTASVVHVSACGSRRFNKSHRNDCCTWAACWFSAPPLRLPLPFPQPNPLPVEPPTLPLPLPLFLWLLCLLLRLPLPQRARRGPGGVWRQ